MTARLPRALSALAIAVLVVTGSVVATAPAAVAAPAAGQVQRLDGIDRYGTSAAISAATFAPGAAVAFIASGTEFADALSGSAAAAARGGPVLLTMADTLPPAIAAELRRLKPRQIVILGGEGAVSPAVAAALATFTTGTVSRQWGDDRYATSADVSARNFAPGVPVAFVASGTMFPDALSGAALAAKLGGPVLLTLPKSLPEPIAAELTRLQPKRLVVLGGEGAVFPAVADAISRAGGRTAERIWGIDRYATAAAVAKQYPVGTATVHLASGVDFPDALSGAAAAGGAPLLLTLPGALPAPTATALRALAPASAVVLGGPGAVSGGVATHLKDFGLARPAASGDRLAATAELRVGTCLTSAGGTYRLCLAANGAVTVMKGGTVLWSSGVTAADAAMLRVRGDGNLVVYGSGGQVRWHTSTGGTAGDRLVVAADGEVTLLSSGGAILWSTMTSADSPTWRLPFAAGQRWAAGAPHTSLGTNSGARGSLDFGPSGRVAESAKKVYTIAAGSVYRFNCGGGRGYLGVNHADGWQSTYYHLKNEQTHLVGKTVPAGTYVGDVAQTLPCGGGSSFEHVHLTIRRNGQPVSVEGMSFGGYTVRSAGSDFWGTWHDAAGRTLVTARGGAACCLTATAAK